MIIYRNIPSSALIYSESFCRLIIFTSFMPSIDGEEKAGDREIIARLESWPLEKLKLEGYCLTDVVALWTKAVSFGRPVAVFQLGPGICLPENLQFG